MTTLTKAINTPLLKFISITVTAFILSTPALAGDAAAGKAILMTRAPVPPVTGRPMPVMVLPLQHLIQNQPVSSYLHSDWIPMVTARPEQMPI